VVTCFIHLPRFYHDTFIVLQSDMETFIAYATSTCYLQ